MALRFLQLILLLLGFLFLEKSLKFGSCSESIDILCKEGERQVLLKIKESLTDPSGRLSSWAGKDCCNWSGVGCNNKTGHVVKLSLQNPYNFSADEDDEEAYKRSCLGGEISPFILELTHLNYLDLSLNNFEGLIIPKFIGSLQNLRYLNLSGASFGGPIPPHLGNLSKLRYLDLYPYSHFDTDSDYDYGPSYPELAVDNLQWLSGLSSLKRLAMGNINLSKEVNWLKVVNMLPSLLELQFPNCQLNLLPPSISFVNITSLEVLDLSDNQFNSSIPLWLSNITSLLSLNLRYSHLRGSIPDIFANMNSLQHLDLSNNLQLQGGIPRTLGSLCRLKTLRLTGNNISGEIYAFIESLSRCMDNRLEVLELIANNLSGYLPDSLGKLKNLRYLRLPGNSFYGSIPASLGNLLSLERLELDGNQMNGTIPESIGNLSNLVVLGLSGNAWKGVVSEAHFFNMKRLVILEMSLTTIKSLAFNVSSEWIPPFQLDQIDLENCQVGPRFPTWLRTQKIFTILVLKNAGIEDIMPNWFWKLSSQIRLLDLSGNVISGQVPSSIEVDYHSTIDLHSNLFQGPLPVWSSKMSSLNLRDNLFSGSMPPVIDNNYILSYLDLSGNFLNGTIPPSICRLKNLMVLNFGTNQLQGELPRCWENFQQLIVVDFSNNNLSGQIPSSMGSVRMLATLQLSNNSLYGEVPISLKKCTSLLSLDLGDNKFSGNIPTWIGEGLSFLMFLRLRSNKFHGDIPSQLCHLTSLQILDLGHNYLKGPIPQCINNLTALSVTVRRKEAIVFDDLNIYTVNQIVVLKGREFQYNTTISLVTSVDLSSNNLSGGIPEESTSLFGLRVLNLSNNHIGGKIPEKINDLRWLESLDLSRNMLTGPIPLGISTLTFLNYLNLSYNNLSGKILSGNQLQTLTDPSIYGGNRELCGPPLTHDCPGDETSDGPKGEDKDGVDEDGFEMQWFYISMGPGFVVGFWGVCGTLIIKKSWRYAYFRFFDDVKNRLLLFIANSTYCLRKAIMLLLGKEQRSPLLSLPGNQQR